MSCGFTDTTGLPGSTEKVEITKGKKHNDDEIIGIVIGILATLILLLFILMIAIIIRQKRGKLYNNHRPVKVSDLTGKLILKWKYK